MSKLPKFSLLAFAAMLSTASPAQWYQGPSGGSGGSPFDFWQESGNSTDISGISVIVDGTIYCLVIAYRIPGKPNRSDAYRHGTCSTDPGQRGFDHSRGISLAQGEYLVGVTGTYGEHINSLNFYTSKGQSISWGTPGPVAFGYTAPSGQRIVAFTGRAGEKLDAIGVMYAPIPNVAPLGSQVPQPVQ